MNDETKDSHKYKKDCRDFICLPDGTKTGEYKYCKWSNLCHQIDFDIDGNPINMTAHFLPVFSITGELQEHQLFCTGIADLRPKKEKIEDDKVS